MKVIRRSLVLSAIVPLLAACGDATGSSNLTPADVSGLYEICTLRFVPDNPTQPAVDVRTQAFELNDERVIKPRIALDPDRSAEILFTRKGQFVSQGMRGTYDLRNDGVLLRIPASEGITGYLLPERLALTYQSAIPELSSSSEGYSVKRADYVRLSGGSEAGLAEEIPGRVELLAQSLPCN